MAHSQGCRQEASVPPHRGLSIGGLRVPKTWQPIPLRVSQPFMTQSLESYTITSLLSYSLEATVQDQPTLKGVPSLEKCQRICGHILKPSQACFAQFLLPMVGGSIAQQLRAWTQKPDCLALIPVLPLLVVLFSMSYLPSLRLSSLIYTMRKTVAPASQECVRSKLVTISKDVEPWLMHRMLATDSRFQYYCCSLSNNIA